MTNNKNVALTDEELDNVTGGGTTYEYELIHGKYGDLYRCTYKVGDVTKSIDVPVKSWEKWLNKHKEDTIIEKK